MLLKRPLIIASLALGISPAIAQAPCGSTVDCAQKAVEAAARADAGVQALQKRLIELETKVAAIGKAQREIIFGRADNQGEVVQIIGDDQHKMIAHAPDHGEYYFTFKPAFSKPPIVIVLPNHGGMAAVFSSITAEGFRFANKPLTQDMEALIPTTLAPFTFVVVSQD